MAASTVLPSTSGNSERMVSHTIPAYEPALCPRMKREPTMYPVNLRKSTGRISGGRHTPTSGCATNNLVKSRRPCRYPGHGGFLCAGITGQKRSSFMARLIICACNWSALGTPKTRHQVCAPMGNMAMCSSKYSCVWAVPAIVPALAVQSSCLLRDGPYTCASFLQASSTEEARTCEA